MPSVTRWVKVRFQILFMTDEEVVTLLDSEAPLVVVEAPAGCGKTYQGASYARRAASRLASGRVLILTHTHAACAAFAKETRTTHHRVEVRTIDSLIVQIAAAYHKSLQLPPDVAAWARTAGTNGYAELAVRVAKLILQCPYIAEALAERFPIVVADEHQDTSNEQNDVIMAIRRAGATLRIFGDPMQNIYTRGTAAQKTLARWDETKAGAVLADLCTPHRWRDGTPALGDWLLQARQALKDGKTIDLTGALPGGLTILYADNVAPGQGFRLSQADRAPIDQMARRGNRMLILTAQNDMTQTLAAFWNRSIPVWEGHTRTALDRLISVTDACQGDAVPVASALVSFLGDVASGFSPSSHGDRLVHEVSTGCTTPARAKPALIQQLSRCILDEPNHVGVSKCLALLARFRRERLPGFEKIKVDFRNEYRDAILLGEFPDVHQGMAEISRRRSFAHPAPPTRAISTIHKAKGLQCDHVLILPCDSRFSSTPYSRCRLYVAISRAKRSLTLVLSRKNPSPLFRTSDSSIGQIAPRS